MISTIRSRLHHRRRRRLTVRLRLMIASMLIVLVAAGCGGTTRPGAGATSTSPTTADAGAPQPVELDVTVATASAATAAAAAADWTVGGSVAADGILAGTFEVFPMCDVRNDAEGEFLNIAFGYQDLADPATPTVRVVAHVRGWRDQGTFETPFEAQSETGTGMDLTLQDAAGEATITIVFIDSVGQADVARIDLEGSFAGGIGGSLSASLTCIAG